METRTLLSNNPKNNLSNITIQREKQNHQTVSQSFNTLPSDNNQSSASAQPNGNNGSSENQSSETNLQNGVDVQNGGSILNSIQNSGCDSSKNNHKTNGNILARRGSGFVNPTGDAIINRTNSSNNCKNVTRKKSSEHHVQFESTNENDSIDPNSVPHKSIERINSIISSESSSSSSSSSSSDSSLDNISQIHPPDGGWGWVVVFASFMVNVIADGITFSFGVMFIEFLHYFGEGKSTTAWIGSLFMSIPLLSGPIASFLTDRYGCRTVTILGGILSAVGFILSSFTDSIFVLLITFGIIAGFGLSLCYVAAVVIVAYYFDANRSFATGLSVCGSGIGTFLFAPLTHYLLKEYGWRGTTLILAGLFLNLCVCGALMRDLPWTRVKAKNQRKLFKQRRRKQRMHNNSINDDSYSQHSNQQSSNPYPSIDELRKLLQQPGYVLSSGDKPSDGIETPSGDILDQNNTARLCSSLVSLPTFVRNGEKVPLEVLESLSNQKQLYSVLLNNYPSLFISSRSFSHSATLNEQTTNNVTVCGCFAPSPVTSPKSHSHPTSPLAGPSPLFSINETPAKEDDALLISKDGTGIIKPANGLMHKRNHTHHHHSHVQQRRLPTAYLRDLRVHRHSLTYRGAMLNINRYRLRASSCPDIYRNSMTTIAKEKAEWYAGLWELWYLLTDMLDFTHFKNVRYLLFALSNFLLYFWYDVPYVYLADNAVESHGVREEDASYLISVIGIVNMVGEVALGWAGDREWVNANAVYAVSMALCGAVLALVPLVKSYESMCGISGFFGLFVAANYSLTSIILVEITTIERFTNAYGLLLLVQGVANLVGPPLAGWLYDLTGSYDLSFYLSGIFIALSGVLLVIPTSDDAESRDRIHSVSNPSDNTQTPKLVSPSQSTSATQSSTLQSVSA